MAHQLKVERSKPCGQLFPLSKGFHFALFIGLFATRKVFHRAGHGKSTAIVWQRHRASIATTSALISLCRSAHCSDLSKSYSMRVYVQRNFWLSH
jgi:hypothetical protein